MNKALILLELENEIARLQQVRTLLAGGSVSTAGVAVKKKRGRPVGSGKLSPQGRERIAEAMKKSWAKRKRLAAETAKR